MSLTKVSYSMIEGAIANIIDYGADPTGVADSTAAIQAAINASKSVYIPPGTFKVTAPIILSQNNFEITGVKGKSILMGGGGGDIFGMFKVAVVFTAEFGLIENLTFDSDDHTKVRWAISTTAPVYLSHVTISECNFNARLAGGIIALMIACHISRCVFGVFERNLGNSMKAIQSIGQVSPSVATTNINVIEQCEFAYCGSPETIVEFETGFKVVFRDCIFEQLTPTLAVVLLTGIAFPVFDGCWFENAQGTTDAGKCVIYTKKDANNISCEVLTVNECLFHTYSTIPSGLINFGDSTRKHLEFNKNFMVDLQSTVLVGGNSSATMLSTYGNSATVDVGGDASGFQYDSPAAFDLGVRLSTGGSNLNDYEENTWTPVGNGVTLTLNGVQRYTKVGRIVTIQGDITFPTTADVGLATISGLPYAAGTSAAYAIGFSNEAGILRCVTSAGSATVGFYIGAANATNADLSTDRIIFSGSYTV